MHMRLRLHTRILLQVNACWVWDSLLSEEFLEMPVMQASLNEVRNKRPAVLGCLIRDNGPDALIFAGRELCKARVLNGERLAECLGKGSHLRDLKAEILD